MQIHVWVNRGLSQTAYLIKALREAIAPGEEFKIFASHVQADTPVKEVCDDFQLEPKCSAAEYVEFALDYVRRNGIHVVLAHTHRVALSTRRADFEALGCKVITAGSPEAIRFLRSKTALYDRVTAAGGLGIAVPEFASASDKASVIAAVRSMKRKHGSVAIKPAAGLGGHGFRIVHDAGSAYSAVYNGDFPPMTLPETEAYIEALKEPIGEMMVMPFLGGAEHSLDCLAVKGKLVKAIDRVKYPGGFRELIDTRPDLVEASARLTELLELDGLYNVQFLESDSGVPYLLEINARMAGGTYLGAFTGVLLPYWAIRIAVGTATADDVPEPKTGILIDRATRQVIDE
jgi:biotin carboxylase